MMKIKTRAAAALSVALLLLAALPVTAYAQSDEPAEDTTPPAQSETTTAKPFTPEGTGTVVDNATDEDGKEFYTITTPSEHVFYLVVDKQRDSENVYFLDAVTEKGLAGAGGKRRCGRWRFHPLHPGGADLHMQSEV